MQEERKRAGEEEVEVVPAEEATESVAESDAAADSGASEGGASANNSPEALLQDRTAELEAEVARLKDQILRQLAETENVRRRADRERKEAAAYGASGLAKDLLNVADNLQRALDALPVDAREGDEALRNLVVGIEMTHKELLAAFEKHGIKRVGQVGERFSYDLHQAMYEVPNTGKPAGTIVEMMQPGYVMHDRLLRAAMVGVAKGDAAEEGPGRVDTTA